jgi:hypothetical protein
VRTARVHQRSAGSPCTRRKKAKSSVPVRLLRLEPLAAPGTLFVFWHGSPGVLLPGYPPGPVYQSRGETAPLATIAKSQSYQLQATVVSDIVNSPINYRRV